MRCRSGDGRALQPGGEGVNEVVFTPRKLAELEREYEDALRAGLQPGDVLQFDGNEYVMGFARYLIEYLRGRLHIEPQGGQSYATRKHSR